MCGIFGIIQFDKKFALSRKSIMAEGLYANTVRGKDATGLAMIPADPKHNVYNEIDIYKRALSGFDFIYNPRVQKMLDQIEHYKFVIGHNRSATRGAQHAEKNAHPFRIDNITLVHNGTLNSIHNLDIPGSLYDYDVDSHALTKAIALHGHEAILKKLDGAAALVWYDAAEDALFMWRNDERPLHFIICKNEEFVIYGSEPLMLQWIADRNKCSFDTYWTVEPHMLIKWTNSVKYQSKEIKPTPKTTTYHHQKSTVYNFTDIINKKKKETTKPLLPEEKASIYKMYNTTYGEVIKIMYTHMEYKDAKKSRHGTMYGTLYGDPYPEIRANGIAKGSFSGQYILTGVVEDLEDLGDGEYAIIVSNVKQTNEPDPSFEAYKHIRPDQVEEEKEEVLVEGPHGKHITLSAFNKIIANGCAKCTGNIFSNMLSSMGWTHDGQPLCPDCYLGTETNKKITH